jgi:MinD-like ATPase involved in chromosome partitioning or flagellar assembly
MPILPGRARRGSCADHDRQRDREGATAVASIVSIHSFRGGTGKSNTTANVAAVLAQGGRRVGVIDADIQSPGIHVLFGLAGANVEASLNDFLFGERDIGEVALDVTDGVGGAGGKLYLIPSSMKPGEITRVLREGYDPHRLSTGLSDLVDELALDVLLIDTHPGLHEETLLSLVLANTVVIIMRPDEQDYEGTGIAVRVAQELQVPRILLVVNKTPDTLDPASVAERVRDAYGCEVAAVLPHSDDLMRLASEGVFSVRYPAHPLADLYRQVVERIAVDG